MKPKTDREDLLRLAMTFALQDKSYEKTDPSFEHTLNSVWPEGRCPHYYEGGFLSILSVLHLLQDLNAPQTVLDELTCVGRRIAKRFVDSVLIQDYEGATAAFAEEEADSSKDVEWPESIEELAGGSNGH